MPGCGQEPSGHLIPRHSCLLNAAWSPAGVWLLLAQERAGPLSHPRVRCSELPFRGLRAAKPDSPGVVSCFLQSADTSDEFPSRADSGDVAERGADRPGRAPGVCPAGGRRPRGTWSQRPRPGPLLHPLQPYKAPCSLSEPATCLPQGPGTGCLSCLQGCSHHNCLACSLTFFGA